MNADTVKVDARGAVVIPARLRRRLGITASSLMLVEERDGRLVLRPALALPVERYAPERRAEFMLNNALDDEDYQRALAAVRAMGLNPADIPHDPPHPPGPRVP